MIYVDCEKCPIKRACLELKLVEPRFDKVEYHRCPLVMGCRLERAKV